MAHNSYVYRPQNGERYFLAKIGSRDARFSDREKYIGCEIIPKAIEIADILRIDGIGVPFFGGRFYLPDHPDSQIWYRVALSFEPVPDKLDEIPKPKKKEELIYEW